MAHSTNFLVDTLLVLNTTAAAITADGAGSGGIIDLGGTGVVRGDVIIDVTACDVASADEAYYVSVEFSSSASFASSVFVHTTATFGVAALANTPGFTNSANRTTGRYILPFINEINGTRYRYMRLFNQVLGTTPSITYNAYATVTR